MINKFTNCILLIKLAGVIASLLVCSGCQPPIPVDAPAPKTDPAIVNLLKEIRDQKPAAQPSIDLSPLNDLKEEFRGVRADLKAATAAKASSSTQAQSVQKSAGNGQARKAYSGYTGCLVHLGPNCPPCVNYKAVRDEHVARHLADDFAWTFGIGEQFHFNELHHAQLDEELPKFEFVRDGQVYHTVIGFNGWNDLAKLFELHPNCNHEAKRMQARAAKYNSVERSGGVAGAYGTSGYRGSRSTGGYGGSGSYGSTYATYGTRARVSGFSADGTLRVEADDDATVGEVRAAQAAENYEQEMWNYRYGRAVNQTQQAYRQSYQAAYGAYGASYGWPSYSTYGTGYSGYVGAGAGYSTGRMRCVNGVCYPY